MTNLNARALTINAILKIYEETGCYAKDTSVFKLNDGTTSEVVTEYNNREELERLSLKSLTALLKQLNNQIINKQNN